MFVNARSGQYTNDNSFVSLQHGHRMVQNANGVGRAMAFNPGTGQVIFDEGLRRPYVDKNDNLAVTINTGRWTIDKGERVPLREHRLVSDLVANGLILPTFVTNATALRKEEWIKLDETVLRAARYRLRLYADINKKSGSYGGFNGMSKMILEHETMADPGDALVDMNGLSVGNNDDTRFQLEGLPLPITHSDFWVDARRLAISRNTGTPFDSNMGEAAARRVGEMVEKTSIGNITGVTYGGASTQAGGYGRTSQVYGLANFPSRLTRTGYKPTLNGRSGTGWVPADTLYDVLAAIDQLRLNKFFGPWMIYHSNDWDQYLDRDYFTTTGVGGINGIATQTLRQRLCTIGEGDGVGDGEKVILGCRRLDFLFATAPSATSGNASAAYYDNLYPFAMFLVQMTPDVIRAVNGLDVTTVQWEEKGGMMLKFKVMCIQVPQIRADFYGNCGILHMTCSS